eukprot:7499258-Pyramimonas_sp.AAC.1
MLSLEGPSNTDTGWTTQYKLYPPHQRQRGQSLSNSKTDIEHKFGFLGAHGGTYGHLYGNSGLH